MVLLVNIWFLIYIFVVRTFYKYNIEIYKNIHELTDRRRGASPSTLQIFRYCEFVRGDLSAVAQNFNLFNMRTNSQENGSDAINELLRLVQKRQEEQQQNYIANLMSNLGVKPSSFPEISLN